MKNNMDIDLLAKMIGELILERDEVSLPGLGTFVAEEVEAAFSDKGFTINPPYRHLSFRQRVTRDNALTLLYARDNSVSEEEAEVIVNGFIRQLGAVLREKKNVILPGLGRLRATKQNNFFFVQDHDADIYPQGFGLESLSLKSLAASKDAAFSPIIPEEEIPVPEEQQEAAAAAPVPTADAGIPVEVKKNNGWAKAILVLAVLCLIFLLAVAVIGRVAPELIDPFLYSSEELELLKY